MMWPKVTRLVLITNNALMIYLDTEPRSCLKATLQGVEWVDEPTYASDADKAAMGSIRLYFSKQAPKALTIPTVTKFAKKNKVPTIDVVDMDNMFSDNAFLRRVQVK